MQLFQQQEQACPGTARGRPLRSRRPPHRTDGETTSKTHGENSRDVRQLELAVRATDLQPHPEHWKETNSHYWFPICAAARGKGKEREDKASIS